MFTYWLMVKFDIFHYQTGMMVATRDNKCFDHPGAKAAAAAIETKALDAAIADGMAEVEKIARTSSNTALSRVSQSIALQRKSLVGQTPQGLHRKSLMSVDVPNTDVLNRIDELQSELEQAAKANPEIQAHVDRVTHAADRLRRVSVAIDRQRVAHAPSSLEGVDAPTKSAAKQP